MIGKISPIKSTNLPIINCVASVTDIDKEYQAKFKKLVYSSL